jgi:hypothetical protein
LAVVLGQSAAGAAYIRGDFFGDRSEEMYAYGERFKGRASLMAEAIRAVQKEVRATPSWSVILPLGNGPERAVIIHARKLTFGDRRLTEELLQELCKRYVAYCVRREKRRQARLRVRLDAVAPQVPAALRRARARRFPVFVADVRSDYGPGVWTLYPDASPWTLETRHKIQPDCYLVEKHELDDAGRFVSTEGPWTASTRRNFLILWAPQQKGTLDIRISRAGRSQTWKMSVV